jgi:hypothetical protein
VSKSVSQQDTGSLLFTLTVLTVPLSVELVYELEPKRCGCVFVGPQWMVSCRAKRQLKLKIGGNWQLKLKIKWKLAANWQLSRAELKINRCPLGDFKKLSDCECE